MRRRGRVVVALLAVAVTALSLGSAGAATRSGTLKGTVLREVFCVQAPCPDLPEGDAKVVARRDGARTRTATTDNRGRFSLRLPRGRWRVTVTAGPRRDAKTVRVRAGRTTRVELVLRRQ